MGAIHLRAPQLLHGEALLILMPALVLLLLVAAVLWELPPAVMLCGAIALTIFSGNWGQLGLPGFPFVPDRILVLGAVLALLLRSPGAASLPHLRVKSVHLLLLVTVVYATASALLTGTLGTQSSTFALLDRLGAIPFLMLLVAPAIFGGPRERNWFLVTLVAIGAYLGLTAIFETFGPQALIFPAYIRQWDIGGTTGAVGPFLAVVPEGFACYGCGVAAIIAFFQWRGHKRWIALVTAVVSLFGSFLTLERGVWIGAVAGAVAVALSAREVRRWLIPVAAVFAVVLTGVLSLSPTLGAATTTRLNDPYSVWDRQNQTAAALRMIEARPLFGFGWSNYVNTATPYFQLAGTYPLSGYPSAITVGVANSPSANGQVTASSRGGVTGALHDSYLTYAVELGLVGACLWLLSTLWGLGSAIFSRGSPGLRPWKLGLIALTVCFLVIAAVDPLSQNFTELLLWTWAGVLLAGSRAPVSEASGLDVPHAVVEQSRLRLPTAPRGRPRIAMTAVAGVVLAAAAGGTALQALSQSSAHNAPKISKLTAPEAMTHLQARPGSHRAWARPHLAARPRGPHEHPIGVRASPSAVGAAAVTPASPASPSRSSSSHAIPATPIVKSPPRVVTTPLPTQTSASSPSPGPARNSSGGASVAPNQVTGGAGSMATGAPTKH